MGEVTLQTIRVFVVLVALAGLGAMAARRIAVPYTVALVVIGLAIGIVRPSPEFEVTPDLVLLVLLPGLVFEAALHFDVPTLRRTFGGVVVLAAPGVVVTAAIVAAVLAVSTGLDPTLGFVVGAMVAATDPVAVIATFKAVRAPRTLATLVEAESVFNDATALVIFLVAIRAATGVVSPADVLLTLVGAVVVSAAIGLATGYVTSLLMARAHDHLVELTLSVAAAYGTYLLADAIHQSGIIATVVAGVVIGSSVRRASAERPVAAASNNEPLDVVWEFIAFLLTALVFLLVGLAIDFTRLGATLPWILWGIVAVLVARVVVVYVLLGGYAAIAGIRAGGRRVPVGWLHVLFWAGLRGAVAVAMALSLPVDFPQRELLQEITFGVVLFTLFAQGTTVEWLIRRVGIDEARGDVQPVSQADSVRAG
ncbi:MAG: cation:proton antiporter [Chloroflexota bacterium]